MDEKTLKTYAAAVSAAFTNQQVLRMQYINERGDISVRKIVPCSPFVINPDGTANFKAYSEMISTTGNDRGPGVYTFRLDRITSLELDPFEIKDVQGFWKGVLGVTNGNGNTVIFPTAQTPLWKGTFPAPTVANGALEAYTARGWTTVPKSGYVIKQTPHLNGKQVTRLQ